MESYFVRFLTYMFAVWWGMLIERDSYTDHMKSLCSMKNYHVTHPLPYSPAPEPLSEPDPLSDPVPEPVIARYLAQRKTQIRSAHRDDHQVRENTGVLARGEVIDVFEIRNDKEGNPYLRFDRGWVSVRRIMDRSWTSALIPLPLK